jgi:hypothetical protein
MSTAHALQHLEPIAPGHSGPAAEFLAYRLGTEAFLRGVDLLNEAVGGNITHGMLLNALWCLELGKTVAPRESLVLAPEWNRPMGIHELGRALALPYSTAHRQLRQMVRSGLAVRTDSGAVALSQAFADSAAGQSFRRRATASFVHMLVSWHRLGYLAGDVRALEQEGSLSPAQEDVVFRAGIEALLQCLLLTARFYDDLVTGLVFKLVAVSNIRHLLSGAQSVPAMAVAVPDEMRRPISVYNAARSLHMPYETTRRISKQLLARNVFKQGESSGLVVTADVHKQKENAEAQLASFRTMAASVAQLAYAGFNLELRPR